MKALKPSLDDPTLLTQKDVYIEQINNTIFQEESDVMVTTAKKVLGRFWRHVIPIDTGTQTEFNLIESLKDNINHLEMVI